MIRGAERLQGRVETSVAVGLPAALNHMPEHELSVGHGYFSVWVSGGHVLFCRVITGDRFSVVFTSVAFLFIFLFRCYWMPRNDELVGGWCAFGTHRFL